MLGMKVYIYVNIFTDISMQEQKWEGDESQNNRLESREDPERHKSTTRKEAD